MYKRQGNWFKQSGKRDQIILASKVAGRAPMNWFRGESTLLDRENIEAGSSKTLRNESVENQIMISCDEGLFTVIY